MAKWMPWLRKVVDCLLRRAPTQATLEPPKPGAQAEAAAARYLEQQGLHILARNFSCRGGEIDLIALHAHTVVFVEVRLRSHAAYGGAAASITPIKQGRVIRAARVWLAGQGVRFARHACRFDAVLFDAAGDPEWLRAAYTLDGQR